MARPDNARHHRAAFAAEELCGEQIVVLAPVHGRSLFVARHSLLHAGESRLVNDRGNGVGDDDVAELVLADILAVSENTKDGVVLHCKALVLDAALIEQLDDIVDTHPVEIAGEDFSHDGRKRLVDLIVVGFVHIIAEWRAHSVALCFESVLRHTALYLFGEFRGIVLSIAFEDRFKQNAVRPLRDTFFGGDDTHTVLFEYDFIVGGIVAVSGKAVELPYENAVERAFVASLIMRWNSGRWSVFADCALSM